MKTSSITAKSSQPTLTELREQFHGAGKEQHVRFEGKRLHTHAKYAPSLVDFKAKFASLGAIRQKTAMRKEAVQHIKNAIDKEYGPGMGERVFGKVHWWRLEKKPDSVKIGDLDNYASTATRYVVLDRLGYKDGRPLRDIMKECSISPNLYSEGELTEILKRMTDAVLSQEKGSTPEKCKNAAKDALMRNVHALQAFGMTEEKVMESLRGSRVYLAAQRGSNEQIKSMTPLQLEGQLEEMLKDPVTCRAIKASGLAPDEAAAIRFYGKEGYLDVQAALRGTDKAAAEVFEPLVSACRRGFAKLPPLSTEIKTIYRRTDICKHTRTDSVYVDPAFVSTTTKKDPEQKFEGRYLLQFDLSNGDANCRSVSASRATVVKLRESSFCRARASRSMRSSCGEVTLLMSSRSNQRNDDEH